MPHRIVLPPAGREAWKGRYLLTLALSLHGRPAGPRNAIHLEAVKINKIDSPVAGRANVLVVPGLEAGNMLAKSLAFPAGAHAPGTVLHARAPRIPTSRPYPAVIRPASCGTALYVAHAFKEAARKAVPA